MFTVNFQTILDLKTASFIPKLIPRSSYPREFENSIVTSTLHLSYQPPYLTEPEFISELTFDAGLEAEAHNEEGSQ